VPVISIDSLIDKVQTKPLTKVTVGVGVNKRSVSSPVIAAPAAGGVSVPSARGIAPRTPARSSTPAPRQAIGGRVLESQDLYPQDDKVPDWASKFPTMYGLYGASAETPKSLKKALLATPASAVQYGKNIAQAVKHPIKTAESLVNLGIGTVEKAIPGRQKHEVYADAVGEHLVESYGSFKNFTKKVETDPVAVLADVASLFMIAGGVVGKAGKLSQVTPKSAEMAKLLGTAHIIPEKVTKVGKAALEAGKAMEPLTAPIKAAGKGAKIAGTVGGHVLGITTGAEYGAVKTAFDLARKGGAGHVLYKEAMRGRVSKPSVLSAAREAMYDLRALRSMNYTQKLDSIKAMTTKINMKPIHAKLDSLMKEFNIVRNSEGKLDFTRSALDRSARPRMRALIEQVEGWGTRVDDTSPRMLDILAKSIDDFYIESGNAKVITTALGKEVRKVLENNVDDYAAMTREYKEFTGVINEINGALSIGGKNADTAIKKLSGALKDSQEYRSIMLSKLDAISGGQLKAQIAGLSFRSPLPEGALGRVLGMLEIMTMVKSGLDPRFFGVLAFSSPRTVGEFLNVLGHGVQIAEKTVRKLPQGAPFRQGLQQAGRVGNIQQTKEREISGRSNGRP
jgi:hypothetical protein